jgi:hypothetical protein
MTPASPSRPGRARRASSNQGLCDSSPAHCAASVPETRRNSQRDSVFIVRPLPADAMDEVLSARGLVKPVRLASLDERCSGRALCRGTVAIRKIAVVIFAAFLGLIMPVAYASPVDPTWLPGFWDNGDFDDVILFLTSDLHLLNAVDRAPLGHSQVVVLPVIDPPVVVLAHHFNAAGPPRAPPTR